MALVPVKEVLAMADKANTSVIAFNCMDYSMIYSVCQAAEKVQKPVLIMLYPGHHLDNNWVDPEGFGAMVKECAEKVSVPIGLHLDHCYDYDYIARAIRAGFTGVMYDGSMLPIEENIANTRKVVDMAHAFGACVEAELGHVGMALSSDQHKEDMYTQPDVAADFIARSGCDSLAVAIGSAHGVYKETPKLDIQRLSEINAATDAPLVLHGGSGIPDDQLDQAFVNGINKFNVGTEFINLYYNTFREYSMEHGEVKGADEMLDFPHHLQKVLIDYLTKKMELSKF